MDPLQARLTDILKAADWDSDVDETFFAEIDQIREEAVSNFTFDRLRSYYVSEPYIYLPVKHRLIEAENLYSVNTNSSLVFAVSASELCLKTLILRHMVYGFVHQTYVARMIAELAIFHTGWDRFADLLSNILRDKLRIDLKRIQLKSGIPLWQEFTKLSTIRNHILHRGENTDEKSAETAIAVAKEFCENIFRQLLSNFSLSIDDHGKLVEDDS